jgi:glucosamine--fructose-6-phosphate aminotransferase (isomerizing)
MCGIVAIVGRTQVAPLIVDALKRLEYRGYDSAGVATIERGELARRRAEGKLVNLENRLKNEPLFGTTGIGHTRWATHGVPNETNAHPHFSGDVAVVHNGIIENFAELRDELAGDGYQFASQTDTEVVAHLVARELKKGAAPVEAAHNALRRLQGAFALAIMFRGDEDLVVGARNGPPLAVGHGDGEMFLGSDAIALAPFTNSITYLEDGDWVVVRHGGVSIFDIDGNAVERRRQQSLGTSYLVDKGNHRHFMEKEIHEQPEVISHTLAHYLDFASGTTRKLDLPFEFNGIDRLAISACGTAYLAGLIGKYWFERYARLPVDIDIASEFRYREMPLSARDAALFISQSGETADTLASLRYCRKAGMTIGAVVNVRESTIARESDVVLPTLAGPEIGVASTKAFTCQLSVLASLAVRAAAERGKISAEEEKALVRALSETPRYTNQALQKVERQIEKLARELLSGQGHQLPAGHGRRAEAQGNLIYPCRGLCGRRAEARSHRSDRRENARGCDRPARPHLRKDGLQYAGGRGARRQDHPHHRREGRSQRHGRDDGHHRHAGRSGDHLAHRLRAANPASGLLHGRVHGHRRRPAAQSRQVGDRGVACGYGRWATSVFQSAARSLNVATQRSGRACRTSS